MEFREFYSDAPKNSVLFNTETPILRQLFATLDDTIFAWTPQSLKAAIGFRLDSTKTEAIFTNSSVQTEIFKNFPKITKIYIHF